MALNKQSVRLGGAYVEITADSKSLYHALNDAEAQIKSFTSQFGAIGAGLAGIGAAITVPLKNAAESYAEFEKQMLITQAVTKATDQQLGRLTEQAKQLGATTSWTTAKVAEGMVALGRMGFTNNEIQNTISSVMDLGRALDVDVNIAAKELGSVMRQFGASSGEASRYADVLASATNGAAIEMSDLLETMKYVGSAGRAIGADVETVLSLVMALRNAGLTASQAGTQLRTMFLKLQNPKNINKFAKEFGVDIYDANGRLKSFIDIIVEAQARASVMGDELAVVARNMFGVLQAPGFITLLQSKDLEKFRDQLYAASGTAENFRENMESGVFGALKLSESAIEAVGLQLGETLTPSVRRVTKMIQDASETIRAFIVDNADLINQIAMAGVKFVSLGGSMLAATGILKGFSAVSRAGLGMVSSLANSWREASAQVEAYRLEYMATAELATKKMKMSQSAAQAYMQTAEQDFKRMSRGATTLTFVFGNLAKALRGLAGMAVSMLAWTAVEKTFEFIANKAHEAAADMAKAQASNAKIMENDAAQADKAEENLQSDEDLIDRLTEGAASNRVLNAVEKNNLKNIFDNLERRGLINGNVVADENSPSGFRVVGADAPFRMKAAATQAQIDELDRNAAGRTLDLHMIAPALFAEGQRLDANTIKSFNFSAYENVGRIIDSMSESQKKKLFGEYGMATWGNDNRLTTSLSAYTDEVYTGSGNVGLMLSRLFNDNSRKAGGDVNEKIFELLNKQLTEAGIYGADAVSLGKYILHLMGIDPNTRKYLTDEIDTKALTAFVDSQGAGLTEFIQQLKEFGKAEEKRAELESKRAAYIEEATNNVGAEFESKEDQERKKILAESLKADRQLAAESLNAMIGKGEEKAKTASQRELEALEEEWLKYVDTLDWEAMDLDEFGEALKNESAYLDRRAVLQKQINEELEREAKERAKENSERVVEGLNADVRDFIGAIFAGNGQKADELGAGIDAQLRNFAGTDVDLSKFYEESVSTIRDALERTKTTLSSTGTFNAYEAADFGRDYQLDVQKEQLAMLRSANRGLQNIYAFMQSDDQYKEFM